MKRFFDRYDHYFIDLWGVLWDGRETFPEAVAFCQALIDAGKDAVFLSNCAEYCVEELVDKLVAAGLRDASPDWIASSGQAMELWFAQNGLAGRTVYCFGGEAVWENTRRAGATPVDLPADGRDLKKHKEADVLVVGGLLNFDWRRMMEVVTAVSCGGLRVVLPNPDVVVVQQTGRITLPAGMVSLVIETAVPSAKVERIGKPYKFIYEYAFSRIGPGARRDRTLMIGDSLDTDARGANNAGIASLLLGQGVHSAQELEAVREMAQEKGVYPDYFVNRLALDAEPLELDWRTNHG